jgi:hypothetical protein
MSGLYIHTDSCAVRRQCIFISKETLEKGEYNFGLKDFCCRMGVDIEPSDLSIKRAYFYQDDDDVFLAWFFKHLPSKDERDYILPSPPGSALYAKERAYIEVPCCVKENVKHRWAVCLEEDDPFMSCNSAVIKRKTTS